MCAATAAQGRKNSTPPCAEPRALYLHTTESAGSQGDCSLNRRRTCQTGHQQDVKHRL